MCGRSTSVTRSRAPCRSASSSRGSSTPARSASLIATSASRHASSVAAGAFERTAVTIGEDQEAAEVLLAIGAAPDGQEVDQLDQEPGVAVARAAHGRGQLAQAGDEPVVADAQERAARDVAHAGRLDHDRAGAPEGEPLVPGQHIVGHEPVVGGAPRDHGGHPGARLEVEAAGVERREPARTRRLVGGRPARGRQRMPHASRGMPHRDDILSLNDLIGLDAPAANGPSYGVAGAADSAGVKPSA